MQNSPSLHREEKLTQNIPTPAFVVYESRLRKNMEKLKKVEKETGVKLIMAFKANALWKTFPIIGEYFKSSTASSVNEMQLSLDYLGNDVHTYCPVYTEDSFVKFLEGSTHITFNSLAQFDKFYPIAEQWKSETGKKVSLGLRVNPKCSVIDHDIYNPAVSGSRFGVSADKMPEVLPEQIEGLHFHALCESDSHDLAKVLNSFEIQFGKYLNKLKWVNFGGGHLITRKDYDVEYLKEVIRGFKERHPSLQIIMEPGSAFTWQTGDLITTVLDVVEDDGVKTAIIDASFACHMPDCLEMPYKPVIKEALPEESNEGISYRLGGNTCLSGDFVGDWKFLSPLKADQRLTLLDMNHYTTVKTNMFNGVQHPSIWLIPENGEPRLLRQFDYSDYRDRMS